MTPGSSARCVLCALALGCGGGDDMADSAADSSADSSAEPSASAPSTMSAPGTSASDDETGPSSSSTSPGSESTGGSSSADASSDGSSGGGPVSPGCGNADATPGELRRMVTIQGIERSYIVDAPAQIDPEHELALAFVFHGNGGTGQGIQAMGLQQVDGAQDEAVFVFPDGLPYMDFGVGWNGTCDEYDMEFFDTMVASLSEEYCIDPARIFAAGFSWGGDMCESLACCRGEVVRAIAPASGPEFYPFDCADTDRPAVRMTYATNDAYSAEMFAQTLEFYRGEHGCSDAPMPVAPEPCITFEDCAKPLISCEYEGLGHAWPADWASETWAFFSQF